MMRSGCLSRRAVLASAFVTMIMQLYTLFALALSLLPLSVSASALTTAIGPNERLCFYADVDKAGEKIGVRPSILSQHLFVLLLICNLYCSNSRT